MSDIKIIQVVTEYPCAICGTHMNSDTRLFRDGKLLKTWDAWDHKPSDQDFVDLDGIKAILEALGHTVRVEEDYEYSAN